MSVHALNYLECTRRCDTDIFLNAPAKTSELFPQNFELFPQHFRNFLKNVF